MAKIKYYYNTETCKYERIKPSRVDLWVNAIGFLFACAVVGFIFSLIHSKYFPSQKELDLIKENGDLKFAYELIDKDLTEVKSMLNVLQVRDDEIYRVIYEQDPIPMNIREAGAGGSKKYLELINGKLSRNEVVTDMLGKIDKLKRQMLVQTYSYDSILNLAANSTELWASMPAIQPISNKNLRRFASGYGYRMHPILKVKKFHYGCDFSAPRGTPIYATGDGKIVRAKKSRGGYGMCIEIEHGFGYKTRYAHMSKFDVKMGDTVKRGQKIGEVGNTGLSVAPHLHYEIFHNGKRVNPINYFHNDLTADQYDKLLKISDKHTQSLGGGY